MLWRERALSDAWSVLSDLYAAELSPLTARSADPDQEPLILAGIRSALQAPEAKTGGYYIK
jgi:hypothetical protein